MATVRCIHCQKVFSTNATSKHANVKCPDCGAVHAFGSMATSTAGDSMLISSAALKQMLNTPRGPGAARAHVRAEPVILCPSCKVRLYVDRKKYGGKRVKCSACGKPMVIPRLSKDLDGAEEMKEESRNDSPDETT